MMWKIISTQRREMCSYPADYFPKNKKVAARKPEEQMTYYI